MHFLLADFPKDQQLVAAQAAILLLPDENREALRTLLFFLRDVVACVDENQMTPTNIAVCLAPSLFHLNTLKRDANAARWAETTGTVPFPKSASGLASDLDLVLCLCLPVFACVWMCVCVTCYPQHIVVQVPQKHVFLPPFVASVDVSFPEFPAFTHAVISGPNPAVIHTFLCVMRSCQHSLHNDKVT